MELPENTIAEPRVLLLSAPWPNHRSPSIQIAALKAYLAANGACVLADHFFLRVASWLGLGNYARVWSPHLEDAEALYGALLFPEQMNEVLGSSALAEKKISLTQDGICLTIPSRRFFRAFAEMHERELDRFDFDSIGLVGLTLNFGQTLASAYLAKRIKARAPHVKIIVGGAEATGPLGTSLLETFPQFDYACSGEGEQSLLALVKALATNDCSELPKSISGRPSDRPELGAEVQQIGELPLPDFDDYFRLAAELHLDAGLCEYIPFETSRGCYYSCSFCSLNLQWSGYRQASFEVVADKISELRRKHGRLGFFFVDNITPVGVSKIADALVEHGVDYRLFYEARVNLDRASWRALAAAGLRMTQLGIEALSDDLLRLYHKKSTVLHNLQALKHCYEFGVTVSGNVILGHPLARPEHVEQSLEAFEYMKAFPPALSFSHYALLVGSPDYKSGVPGLRVTGNYSLYARAYPQDVMNSINLPRKSYVVEDNDEPVADFKPLVRAIETWERDYSRHQARFGGREPILSLQDGGDFLRIEDWRSGTKISFDLDSRERAVYLAMAEATRLKDLAKRTSLEIDWVKGAAEAFDREKLAYVHGDRALALALRKRGAPA